MVFTFLTQAVKISLMSRLKMHLDSESSLSHWFYKRHTGYITLLSFPAVHLIFFFLICVFCFFSHWMYHLCVQCRSGPWSGSGYASAALAERGSVCCNSMWRRIKPVPSTCPVPSRDSELSTQTGHQVQTWHTHSQPRHCFMFCLCL